MNYRDRLIEDYIKGSQVFYPELQFGEVFSMYSGLEPTSGKFEFSNQGAAIKSNYSINDHRYFIHYTSLQSLFAIINSTDLRLSNLYNLNDPLEFKYSLAK